MSCCVAEFARAEPARVAGRMDVVVGKEAPRGVVVRMNAEHCSDAGCCSGAERCSDAEHCSDDEGRTDADQLMGAGKQLGAEQKYVVPRGAGKQKDVEMKDVEMMDAAMMDVGMMDAGRWDAATKGVKEGVDSLGVARTGAVAAVLFGWLCVAHVAGRSPLQETSGLVVKRMRWAVQGPGGCPAAGPDVAECARCWEQTSSSWECEDYEDYGLVDWEAASSC